MRVLVPVHRLPHGWEDVRGLEAEEVLARRAQYGRNDVRGRPPRSALQSLREAAGALMLWFLGGTSALYFALGEHVDGAVMLRALVPLPGMDVFLHHRTQDATEGLRGRLAERATVLRDGREAEVPADLARVEAGSRFPADGWVVRGQGLQAEESSLTCESMPVRKRPLEQLPHGAKPALDAVHWGLAGTRLLTGTAWVRVVSTGAETLYGSIIRSAGQEARGRTPLQHAVAHLVALLVGVAAALCAVLALVRLRQGDGWLDALLSAAPASLTLASATFAAVLTRLRTRTARWGCALSLGLSVLLLQVPEWAALVGLHPPLARDWGRVLIAVAVALVPLLVAGPHARGSLFRGHGRRAGRPMPTPGAS